MLLWVPFLFSVQAAVPDCAGMDTADTGYADCSLPPSAGGWDSGEVDGISGATQTTDTTPPPKKGCATVNGTASLGLIGALMLVAIRRRAAAGAGQRPAAATTRG
ncbi:MAG: MYXO-CTERM domain-containing protein [Myxococcota bacterium]|jgi:MYXO-CTERM domain-containing protein